MANLKPQQSLIMDDSDDPLVFAGPPGNVRGWFGVHNPGDRKIVVRQAMLRLSARQPTEGASLRRTSFALRRIVVRPQQSRPVHVAVALDPRTPPGTYRFELDVQGQVREATMHVTEEVSLRVDPQTVVLPSHRGEKLEKRVVFVNEGNVPVEVGSIGPVILEDDLAHCRALRGALADVGESLQKFDDFVVALARQYRAVYAPLVLRVQNDKVRLAPGETASLFLKVTLPAKLDARSRYTAVAPISTSTLTFAVVPD